MDDVMWSIEALRILAGIIVVVDMVALNDAKADL